MTYKENGRTLKIDSELLDGEKYDEIIYWSQVSQWEPPFDGEKLSEAEKTRIKGNIEKKLKGVRVDWV